MHYGMRPLSLPLTDAITGPLHALGSGSTQAAPSPPARMPSAPKALGRGALMGDTYQHAGRCSDGCTHPFICML